MPGWTVNELAHEVRVCLRGLLRAPIMTLTIVATVGLGIGTTTVIFAAIEAALLRPLPYAESDRLVRIFNDSPPNKFRFSLVDWFALEAQQTHFEQIAASTEREMAFSDGSVAERVRGREVTWTWFSLLGLRPAFGRGFTEVDGRQDSPRTVIVSHSFWQERLGGRTDAVGSTIKLDGLDYAVAGVLPASVGPLEARQEFFVPARYRPPQRKGPFMYIVLGRLRADAERSGAERSAAAEELRAICTRIFPLWQSSWQDSRTSWGFQPLQTYVVGDVRTVAGLAIAAVALVWLIACANASNLLIARVTSRRRELAVRAALGASRGRVVRHLLAESVLLALAAALLGVGVAWLGVDLLRTFGTGYFPRTREIGIGGPVLALLTTLTAASVLLFGLIPAVHGSGGAVDESLRAGGRSSTGTISVRRLRRALVATQFAIATPLLVVAGLLLASLHELGRVDLGFDTRNLFSGSISLPTAQYRDNGRVVAFWDELQRRVESLPGVAGVAYTDSRPPNGAGDFNNFDLEDMPTPPGQSQPITPWVAVTPEYFRLLGLAHVEGRLFEPRDGLGPDLLEVVVDRAWAQRFFPNGTAVGKRLKSGGCTTCPWTTVVGVVSEVKYAGVDQPDRGTVYMPMGGRGMMPQEGGASPRTRYVLVRTTENTTAEALMPTVRRVLREMDPSLPFSSVATIDTLVSQSLQRPRSLSVLVGSFAVVALLLSVIGIYGVMAYYVQQQAKDISIRVALGGTQRDVLRLIVGQGMKVVATGVALGLLTAFGVTRWLSTLLFGVGATDALTFATVTLALIGVALLACIVPARRAAGMQPASVLRNE